MNDVFGKALNWGTADGRPPTGAHCCRGVALAYPFLDYAAAYEAAINGRTTFTRQDGALSELIPDILVVGPMIRMVGVVDRDPFGNNPTLCVPRKIWRCIHCIEADGFRCAIYDKRPQMCRTYPADTPGSKCEFRTCGSTHCPNHPSREAAHG
jgi:Fe-S-cluster containining protein